MSDDDSKDDILTRVELAESRTDWAEDRTMLANERTFAGWLRTGLAAIGIGVGFHVLFGAMEPAWVPKATATLFIALGIVIFWTAEHRARTIVRRLETHRISRVSRANIRALAALFTLGSLVLVAGLWLLETP